MGSQVLSQGVKGAKYSRTGQVAILLVFVVMGMMLSVQFRVQRRLEASLPFQRQEELAAQLKAAEKERDALRDEVGKLRETVSKGTDNAEAMSAMERQLNQVQLMAGLVNVKGPGVTVVLDDSKRPRQKNEDPNIFILHDDDLLKVVNELRAAGAEAIAVNGQRLIGTSEIRCAGPTVSINNTRTAPPVTILAIGEPATLEASLLLRGGIVDSLKFFGIEVFIKKESEVLVPAYKGPIDLHYARPAKAGGV